MQTYQTCPKCNGVNKVRQPVTAYTIESATDTIKTMYELIAMDHRPSICQNIINDLNIVIEGLKSGSLTTIGGTHE